MRFSKRKLHFLFLSFYVGEIETEKRKTNKTEKAKKPCKNGFLGWSSKKEKNQKMDFSKNWLTLFVSGREKKAPFRAHYLFWSKFFLDQNSANQETL